MQRNSQADEVNEADDNIVTNFNNGAREIPTPEPVAYWVQTRQSPHFDVFHSPHVIRVTVDSGVTNNMIRHSAVDGDRRNKDFVYT